MSGESEKLFTQMLKEAGIPTTEAAMRTTWDAINTAEGSQITNNSAWSPFWRLISAIVTKPGVWLASLLIKHALPNVFLKFASGAYLDVYAWGVDLARKQATQAEGLVVFTRAEAVGTLSIPAGTLVESPAINGVVHRVATTVAALIPDGQLGIEVAVRALEAGSAANLGPGYYSVLPEPIPGIASVTNAENWLLSPGADEEADEALRLRARNQFQAVGQYHHDAAYRAVVTSFAGIQTDYVFFEKDGPRGSGTANGYIMLESGLPPDDLIERVNTYVSESGNHGHGDDCQFFAIPALPVDLTVAVHPVPSCSLERTAALLVDVENMVRAAFRQNQDIPVSKTFPRARFSFSQLDRELHEALPDLLSVEFDRSDIVAALTLPVLRSLMVQLGQNE